MTAAARKTAEAKRHAVAKIQTAAKKDSRSKTASGSKDRCDSKTMKENKESTKTEKHHFYRATKNMRSMNSSERIEEMVHELEGYRWDAVLLNETWRPAKSEIWETHQRHIYM